MRNMKFALILVPLILLVLFVSCSQPAGDELVDICFGSGSMSRELSVRRTAFDDGDFIWYYTAVKTDGTGFRTGETGETKTPVKAVTSADRKGLHGAEIKGMSQGSWHFTVYAYTPENNVTDYTDKDPVWSGGADKIIVKGSDNSVDITVSPASVGTGTIKFDIVVKDSQSQTVTGGTWTYSAKLIGSETVVPIVDGDELASGAYIVTVVFEKGTNSVSDVQVVNICNGLTSTVWGELQI